MMRFLHAADLHLDSPLRSQTLKNPELAHTLHSASRQVLSRITDAAIAQKVDGVLLAGDLFDSDVADITSRATLAADMGRLDRAGIQVAMIRGNHDALLDFDRFGPLARNVTLLDRATPSVKIKDAWVHGLSFTERHSKTSMLPDYPKPTAGHVNLGLMHTSLDGSENHDPYAPCASQDLLAHGFEYWALGHIHQRFERRSDGALAVMPGIPQGRSIRETGVGSATLVEVDLNGVRATPLPMALMQFERVDVDLSAASNQADALTLMQRQFETLTFDCDRLAARLIISGAGALGRDAALIQQLAQDAADPLGTIHIEAVRLTKDTAAPPPGMIRELAQMMQSDITSPGFQDSARAALLDWQKALPRDIADALDPAQIEAIAQEGMDHVLRRLTPGHTSKTGEAD